MTLSQLLVWFALRSGPYTSTNVISRELGDVRPLLEHLVSLKLLGCNNGAYRLINQSKYWGSRNSDTIEILERDKMKCKHCDVPVVSKPMPMALGQTKPSHFYWSHDFGGGLFMIHAYYPYGNVTHAAAPREESFPLWIYLHQTRAWERQESTTVELRDYLRAVWRSAGHATAVVR